jgi:hypothetical protein
MLRSFNMSDANSTIVTISALMDTYQTLASTAQEQQRPEDAELYQAAYQTLADIQNGLIVNGGVVCLPYTGEGNGRRLFNSKTGEWGAQCEACGLSSDSFNATESPADSRPLFRRAACLPMRRS